MIQIYRINVRSRGEKYTIDELVYEKVKQFLAELRCEDMDRGSRLKLEACQRLKEKRKDMENRVEIIVDSLSVAEKKTIVEYHNLLYECCFEESQQAYLQGIVDCILGLASEEIIKPQKKLKEIIKIFL